MQRTCLSAWDHYLISLGGSPAVVSCTCWWVHGPVKQEAKPTDIHLEPTEQSTLICVSLAAFPPRPPLPFPLTARARTRERADAQPIFTKNSRALYLINSAQIEKSHVDGALELAAIAVWQGMKNSTHLLGSCGPNSGILHLYPIGEAAPGLYGARTWRMTRAKFSDSQCDLQPASELFPSAPRGGVV